MSSPRKVAIVTGAAQGIGKAIALRLARDGFHVVISDLPSKAQSMDDVVAEALTNGGVGAKAISIACNVREEKDVQNLVDQTVEKLGRLDCMVANAGIGGLNRLTTTTVEEYDRVMETNSRGVMLSYRCAALAMIKGGTAHGGRIVGACSTLGKKGQGLFGAYCASKFAIRGLTQVAATEFGEHGINVNAYAPGMIDTPLLRAGGKNMGKFLGVAENFFVDQVNPQTCLKRVGTADEVANLVSFLASEQSSFITGNIQARPYVSMEAGFATDATQIFEARTHVQLRAGIAEIFRRP